MSQLRLSEIPKDPNLLRAFLIRNVEFIGYSQWPVEPLESKGIREEDREFLNHIGLPEYCAGSGIECGNFNDVWLPIYKNWAWAEDFDTIPIEYSEKHVLGTATLPSGTFPILLLEDGSVKTFEKENLINLIPINTDLTRFYYSVVVVMCAFEIASKLKFNSRSKESRKIFLPDSLIRESLARIIRCDPHLKNTTNYWDIFLQNSRKIID